MRNRYLDLLRAAAILRVIVYHLFGWPWLTIVLPAMGVMFALGGSLMAASLDGRAAGQVVTSRLRRLLPPLWVFGLVAIPLMLAYGWAAEDGEHPFDLRGLLLWVVPVGDPTGSDWGIDLWEPLWYLRAYLWFVLLSPLLYPVYRRLGWVAVAAPIALLGALELTGFSLPDPADAAMWDFAVYGACWIAGFAHHDGRLTRLRPWVVLASAALLGVLAWQWLHRHPGGYGMDLNEIPESQALWSLAFVLLALRWQPPMGWLQRMRPVRALVDVCNARAVTIYLWHNGMIALVWPVLTWLVLDDLGRLEGPVTLTMVLVMTAIAAVAFGWVEDLAARRRPRLWPTGPRSSTAAGRPEPVAAGPAPQLTAPQLTAPPPTAPRPLPTHPTPTPPPTAPQPRAAQEPAAREPVAQEAVAQEAVTQQSVVSQATAGEPLDPDMPASRTP